MPNIDTNDPVFSLEEVNAMIPGIHEALTRVLQLRALIYTQELKLKNDRGWTSGSILESLSFGEDPHVTAMRGTLTGLQSVLADELDALREMGCVVRSIEPGIIEWPSVQEDGRAVLLGWRYGNDKVGYWRESGPGTELHPID